MLKTVKIIRKTGKMRKTIKNRLVVSASVTAPQQPPPPPVVK
jgi:hypothetical protein